jgi:hypothetical protein
MHDISHAILRLAVHLPKEQMICYKEGSEREAVEATAVKATTLTAWFELNAKQISANQYLDTDIPEHFVFDRKTSSWQTRKKHIKIISRMYTVSPIDAERYYLRLLLLNVKGVKSFDHLKTVDSKRYSTFKEAAIALNLLADDKEWDEAIEEAGSFQMPAQLRQSFAYIRVYGPPKKPKNLWLKHLKLFTEDFEHKGNEDYAESFAMREVENILQLHGRSYQDFDLPKPLSREPSRICFLHLFKQSINFHVFFE